MENDIDSLIQEAERLKADSASFVGKLESVAREVKAAERLTITFTDGIGREISVTLKGW